MVSDADVVVLSLLAESPRHGYDLDRVIEERGYRSWTSLAFSSVYYVLNRLAERGLVEPDAGSASRRTVFRLAAAGAQELSLAAAERISTPDRPTAAALPALGAYPRLDDPALQSALRDRVRALDAQIARLRTARDTAPAEHARAIFGYELARHRADRAWTRDLLDSQEETRPSTPSTPSTSSRSWATSTDPAARTSWRSSCPR